VVYVWGVTLIVGSNNTNHDSCWCTSGFDFSNGGWLLVLYDNRQKQKKRKEKEVSLNMLCILLLSMYSLLTMPKANVKIMVVWLVCEVDVR